MWRVSRLEPKSDRGFTLIEVVVAMAILSVAMIAIVQSATKATGDASYLTERTLAHWVAMNKLAEVQLQSSWPSVGESKGTYKMSHEDWRWRVVTSGTEDEAVRRVDISVFPKETSEPIATVIGYVGKP